MIFVDKNLENTLVMDHAGWPVRAQYQASAFVRGVTLKVSGLMWDHKGGTLGYRRLCQDV